MTLVPALRKAAWILAAASSVALGALLLLSVVLYFLVSYGQPAGTYTGQDYDRALSWVLAGMLAGAWALAVVIIRLPVRYRRLRALARSDGLCLTRWLAGQQSWRLAWMLMGFNGPVMVVVAVAGALAAIALSYHSAPAGAVLWAAAGGCAAAAAATAVQVAALRCQAARRGTRAQSAG